VVFARLGTDVPLKVVAQEAGVGRGTLYRPFPSREHMLAAIMRDNAAALEEKARELIEALELSDEGQFCPTMGSGPTRRSGRRDVTATEALALISSLPKDPATGRTAKPYLDVALEGLQVLTDNQ
jgi:AcrR family transcriptional regulator